MVAIGMVAEGEAVTLLRGGEAVVKVGEQRLLVANALPGDRLKVRVTGKRRGALRGEIVEVIDASKQRIEALCPVAARCGGCALQYLSAADQAAVKSGWVEEVFAELMNSGCEWEAITPDSTRARRRLRWFVGSDDDGPFLGFRAPASHDVIRHPQCMAITEHLNMLRRLIETSLIYEGLKAVQAVELVDGIHVILESDERPESISVAGVDGLPLQWWWQDGDTIVRPLQKPVVPFHDRLPAGDSELLLAVGPQSFVQGQYEGNRELISTISAWAGSVQRIADLFCGIGNLSIPIAVASGATVVGAELNAASIRAATASAEAAGVDATFYVANLFEDFDLEPCINADLLILDPPRRGAKRICSQMSRLMPAKIAMVSCDPAAGARDGKMIAAQGYRMVMLKAFDLFPGAGHVETLSLWERM